MSPQFSFDFLDQLFKVDFDFINRAVVVLSHMVDGSLGLVGIRVDMGSCHFPGLPALGCFESDDEVEPEFGKVSEVISMQSITAENCMDVAQTTQVTLSTTGTPDIREVNPVLLSTYCLIYRKTLIDFVHLSLVEALLSWQSPAGVLKCVVMTR